MPLAFTVLAFACAACSSGSSAHQVNQATPSTQPSDRVLHVRDYDIVESAVRDYLRRVLVETPLAGQLICREVRGLSAAEARHFLDDANPTPAPGSPTATAIPESTPRSGQEGVPGDRKRMAAILLEECNRLYVA